MATGITSSALRIVASDPPEKSRENSGILKYFGLKLLNIKQQKVRPVFSRLSVHYLVKSVPVMGIGVIAYSVSFTYDTAVFCGIVLFPVWEKSSLYAVFVENIKDRVGVFGYTVIKRQESVLSALCVLGCVGLRSVGFRYLLLEFYDLFCKSSICLSQSFELFLQALSFDRKRLNRAFSGFESVKLSLQGCCFFLVLSVQRLKFRIILKFLIQLRLKSA